MSTARGASRDAAHSYEVRTTPIVSVEHPGIVRNPGKAVESLGGASKVEKVDYSASVKGGVSVDMVS